MFPVTRRPTLPRISLQGAVPTDNQKGGDSDTSSRCVCCSQSPVAWAVGPSPTDLRDPSWD